MKGKYITTTILMACLSKPKDRNKDIHAQLRETVAELRKIRSQIGEFSKQQADLLLMKDKEALAFQLHRLF